MKLIKKYLLRTSVVLSLLLLGTRAAHAQSQICIVPSLQSVLDSFITEVDTDGNINEIHVNQISPNTYQTVIYSGDNPLSSEGVPSVSTTYQGVTFFLYTPLEHYFYPCDKEALPDTTPILGPPNGVFWIVTDRDGAISVAKNTWIDPYNTLFSNPMAVPQQ